MANQSKHFARLQQGQMWLFTLLTIAILLILGYQLPRGILLETNLQALFPKDKNNQLSEKINEQFYREFGNKLLIAVQAQTTEEVQAAANVVAQAINENPKIQISSVNESAALLAQQGELLQQYRYKLLTPLQQAQLNQQQHTRLLAYAQNALFGFTGNGNHLSPLEDPLALNSVYLQQLQPALNGELINNRLLIKDPGGQLILFALALKGESFNVATQEEMALWLSGLRDKLALEKNTGNAQLLVSGAIFHAAEASANAKREVSFIGTGSTLGCIFLFIFTFFRVRPLLLSIASIAYGFLLALAFNLLLFEKIHLMTLVFGASLIGVAIDYSIHYLCKHQELFKQGSGSAVIATITKNLTMSLALGLFTSVVGYACLLQSALPGLQQIASFSIVGLCGSWLFVMVTYPYLMKAPLPQPYFLIEKSASFVWRLWAKISTSATTIIFVAIALFIIFGLMQFTFSSDIRTFYKPSNELQYSEQRLQQALQGVSPNQYFILRAASVEDLLQAEEKFRRDHLDPLVAAGALKAYSATSSLIPSSKQQQKNYALMRTEIYKEGALADSFMRSAGFDAGAIEKARSDFNAAEKNTLTIDAWLEVARPDQRLLWLGKIDESYLSIIGLRGVNDINALAALGDKSSIIWFNRVGEMSLLLEHMTRSASYMLLLAYAMTLIILWISYRRYQALLLVCVPMLATLLTLSLLSLCQVPINLFHVFGCYLILGLGMDYSIFSYMEGLKDPVSQRSIFLSVITSALSFGLLALSSTPMVNAFGVTLLLGCFLNLLFAPLVGNLNSVGNSKSGLVP